ncbi:MAG: DNA (cytosine-5-)-methyltransferase [Deltaproteobacteria bacterium]|nr:DNA (cytosine-5-)-methyltransferase [Deltaproteobacteria bacterium]
MKYLSVCSGIEAATVAFRPLGWKAVAFSEIDPFCAAVLKHHYPEVPNLGDMNTIDGDLFRDKLDLIIGGTPCQSFSIAGARNGFTSSNGQLTLSFFRLVDWCRPRWFIWENVSNVLQIDKGRVFRDILLDLENIRYSVAWRVLDSQFFGVPQRRRRVFLVGHYRDWRGPGHVLFDPYGLSKNYSETSPIQKISPNRETDPPIRLYRQDIVGTLKTRCCRLDMHNVGGDTLIKTGANLRYLTPLEFERLMGFPDYYTLIPYKNKLLSDFRRYKLLGNSMVTNVIQWLGKRIQDYDTLC